MSDEALTEEEAFDRITEIGTAFANDLNDGDSKVLYEGVHVEWDGHTSTLNYSATLENGTEVVWRWAMLPLEYKEEKGDDEG